MRDEPKSVLENVARLERENADLKERIAERVAESAETRRAQEALEETIHTRSRAKPSSLRFAAAISFGLAFGLVTLAVTLLLMPPPSPNSGYYVRGGSAGVCR
jgi:hypothetical protein